MSPCRLLLSAFIALLALPAAGQSLVDRAARDEIAYMGREEPAMQDAFRKAGATLEDFLRKASRPAQGATGHALKVAVSDTRGTEYFWVSDFIRDGDAFVGTLDNEPRLVMKHRLGDRIAFTRAQIADWVYIDQVKGRMMGNFTACALLTKELPAQAEMFKRRYGLACD